MELGRLWKLSIPEIKVYQRKTKHGELKTSKFCQENPKAGDINYGMIAHGMTRAETWLSVMSLPADAIVTVLS